MVNNILVGGFKPSEKYYSYGPTNSYKWEYFMIYNLS